MPEPSWYQAANVSSAFSYVFLFYFEFVLSPSCRKNPQPPDHPQSPSPSTPSLLPPVQNLWWTAGGGRPRFSASARRRQWLGGIRGAMQLLVDRVLHCLRTLSSTGVDRYDAACGSPVFLRYPQPSLGFQAEERLANGDGPSCLGTLAYETRTHVVPEKPHLLCSPLVCSCASACSLLPKALTVHWDHWTSTCNH